MLHFHFSTKFIRVLEVGKPSLQDNQHLFVRIPERRTKMATSNSNPAALVTGANKGIGFEIVRQLSQQFKGTVYLTARDADRGKEAEKTLQTEGLSNVKFLQMDVVDKKSIEKARDIIMKEHGGLDILINNAGIAIMGDKGTLSANQSAEAVKSTIATNFTGLLDVCKIFFPILRAHARVVNVSSSLSNLRHLKSEDLKSQMKSNNLTVEQLEKIMEDYVRVAEKGNPVEAGYPDQFGPYAMSKIGVTALSRVQQRNFDQDKTRPDIVVNACCPGYVATDINNNSGSKTTQQGAETPVYLALLPASTGADLVKPRGEFLYEKRVINWLEEEASHS